MNVAEKLFPKETERKNAGQCPFCGVDPVTKGFKDSLSKKEFQISGLCQSCQDEVFVK